jgi:hypothetical protein
MLSMTFISVMLVAIAMCIIQMSTIYTRGETLRLVNQASRSVAADMQRTFAAASPESITAVVDNGRLCTGGYTYIWNSRNESNVLVYENNVYSTAGRGDVYLVKITDAGGRYCRPAAGGVTPNVETKIPNTPLENPVELLQEGDRSLVVHNLTVDTGFKTTHAVPAQQLYRIAITLGTKDKAEIDTTSSTCKPPSDTTSNINYCAINQVSFTIRAGVR